MDQAIPTLTTSRRTDAAAAIAAESHAAASPGAGAGLTVRPAQTGQVVHPGSALVRWVGSQPVVVLSGELDISVAGHLGSVGRLLRQWPTPVVTDAADVTFLDAGGLRAVLSLAGPGAAVVLQRPSAAVLRLVQLAVRVDAGVVVEAVHEPPGSLALTGLAGW